MARPKTKKDIIDLQRDLNHFSNTHLAHTTPLFVDGSWGPATEKRIKQTKWYIGYVQSRCTAQVGHEFRVRLRHPEQRNRWAKADSLKRGRRRRHRQHLHARRNQVESYLHPGVTRFDGIPVAKCAVPILLWARAHGWRGRLVSGYRDPFYSRHLCIVMCGRPSCPGRCAGLSSNHVGSSPTRFALDVTDYLKFAGLMRVCPIKPHIHNSLPYDRVHFSPSGS